MNFYRPYITYRTHNIYSNTWHSTTGMFFPDVMNGNLPPSGFNIMTLQYDHHFVSRRSPLISSFVTTMSLKHTMNSVKTKKNADSPVPTKVRSVWTNKNKREKNRYARLRVCWALVVLVDGPCCSKLATNEQKFLPVKSRLRHALVVWRVSLLGVSVVWIWAERRWDGTADRSGD